MARPTCRPLSAQAGLAKSFARIPNFETSMKEAFMSVANPLVLFGSLKSASSKLAILQGGFKGNRPKNLLARPCKINIRGSRFDAICPGAYLTPVETCPTGSLEPLARPRLQGAGCLHDYSTQMLRPHRVRPQLTKKRKTTPTNSHGT